MRRWSWAGLAMAAWVLATVQLPAPTAASAAAGVCGLTERLYNTEISYNITALPETCGYLRKDFGTKYFDYQAEWTTNASIPDGCTLEITKLYMEGSCSPRRKSYTYIDHFNRVGGSNASCEAVLRNGDPSWWSTLSSNTTEATMFDADSRCAESPIGYFYIHNSCNQAISFAVTIRFQSQNSCPVPWYSGNDSGWWALFVLAAVAILLVSTFLVAFWYFEVRDKRPQSRP